MPAFNEQGRIRASLERIVQYLDRAGLTFEVIVVDDGSSDRTAEIVGDFARHDPRVRLVQNRRNLGKGAAVRTGIRSAAGSLVLFTDADLSTPIEELEKLLPWVPSNGLVIASRSLPESNVEVHQPFYRELMGRIYNLFVRVLVVRGLIDTQCGFKLMTRDAAADIARRQRINSFSFDVEMILIARRLEYGVKEIPVRWINSPASRVHPVLDSAQMLLDLFRIRFYDILGFYRKGIERE